MEARIGGPRTGSVDIWWARLAEGAPRRRSAEARAIVDCVLGRYLSAPRIERGAAGKPCLAGCDNLSFNLSHSGSRLVVAVADGVSVGVDCEAARPFPDLMALARMICSDAELALLRRSDAASAIAIFHDLWTRKEAVLKAIGVGLSFPLSELTVAAPAGSALVRVEAGEYGTWWLRSIDAPCGFAAACACREPFDLAVRRGPDAPDGR